MFENIPLNHILFLTIAMFFIGVYGFLTRKNLVTVLISVELMLNAVNINFVAFDRYLHPGTFEGHFFSLFVIAIAAGEAAVGLAIIIVVFRGKISTNVDEMNLLKW